MSEMLEDVRVCWLVEAPRAAGTSLANVWPADRCIWMTPPPEATRCVAGLGEMIVDAPDFWVTAIRVIGWPVVLACGVEGREEGLGTGWI